MNFDSCVLPKNCKSNRKEFQKLYSDLWILLHVMCKLIAVSCVVFQERFLCNVASCICNLRMNA